MLNEGLPRLPAAARRRSGSARARCIPAVLL